MFYVVSTTASNSSRISHPPPSPPPPQTYTSPFAVQTVRNYFTLDRGNATQRQHARMRCTRLCLTISMFAYGLNGCLCNFCVCMQMLAHVGYSKAVNRWILILLIGQCRTDKTKQFFEKPTHSVTIGSLSFSRSHYLCCAQPLIFITVNAHLTCTHTHYLRKHRAYPVYCARCVVLLHVRLVRRRVRSHGKK